MNVRPTPVFNIDRDSVVILSAGECAVEYRTLKHNKHGVPYIDVHRIFRTSMESILLTVNVGPP